VTSATPFYLPSGHPYVLCTTSPSDERGKHCREQTEHYHEWTYISAIGDGPARVPEELEDNLTHLEKHEAIIVGTVSAAGDLVAVLERGGRVTIFPLRSNEQRLLRGANNMTHVKKLSQQWEARGVDPTSLRFHATAQGVRYLKAIDIEGNLLGVCLDAGAVQPAQMDKPRMSMSQRIFRRSSSSSTNFSGTRMDSEATLAYRSSQYQSAHQPTRAENADRASWIRRATVLLQGLRLRSSMRAQPAPGIRRIY
jgi:hypothetical protein